MKAKEMVLGAAVETDNCDTLRYIFDSKGLYVPKMGAHPLSLAKERFLVLNDVLHGRKPGETLYAEVLPERMAYLMGVEDATATVDALCKLADRNYQADIEELGLNDMSQVIARFLHASDYCFLVKDENILTIDHVNSVADGKMAPEVITNIISLFFDHAEIIDGMNTLEISDGVLKMTADAQENLHDIIWKGYERYRHGLPKMRRKQIDTLSKYARVHEPANMTAKQFAQALSTIVLAGRNPKVWLELFVDSPDFGTMFKKYGACLVWMNGKQKIASILLDDNKSNRMYEAAIAANSLRDMLDMSGDSLFHAYVNAQGGIALNNLKRITDDDVVGGESAYDDEDKEE